MLISYSTNGKITCPNCGSSNFKAMKLQPKKYPQPIAPSIMTDSYHQALYNWQNGYVCQKCATEFISKSQVTSSVQPISTPAPTARPLPPPKKKKGGFLWKLAFWVMLIFFGLMAWGWYENQNKSTKSKPAKVAKSDNIEKSQDKNDTLSITETKTIKAN